MAWPDYGIRDMFGGTSGGSKGPDRINWLGMDKGVFLLILALVAVGLIVIATGSVLIFHNLWDLLMRLSTTIPLPIGIGLLIVLFVVLRKPKQPRYSY